MGTPPPIEMANLGMADSLILMVLALVVFGPRRLPQIGRQIGKLMYEFRKASNDFKYQMEEELRNAEEADRRKKEEERLKALALAAPAQTIEPVSQVSDSQVSEANPHPSDEDLSPGTPKPGAPTSEGNGISVTDGTSLANGEAAVTSPYPGEIEYPAGAMAAAADTPGRGAVSPYSAADRQASRCRRMRHPHPRRPRCRIPQSSAEPGAAQEQAQEQQPSAATEPVAHHG